MGKIWQTAGLSAPGISVFTFLAWDALYFIVYPGLVLQYLLKEEMPPLVLFVYLIFSELSQICGELLVYNREV